MKKSVIWWLLFVGIVLIAIPTVIVAVSGNESTPTPTVIPGESFVYDGISMGLTESADYDGDYISDRIEYWELHTDPTSIYTEGNPIDDYNAVYTYDLNPLNSAEIAEFMASIPNVEAGQWDKEEARLISFSVFVEIAKRDPLNQWYAGQTAIEWEDSDHTRGLLLVNNEPFFLKYEYPGVFVHPAYYLTHGRVGTCADVAAAHYVTLELMGYDCLHLTGLVGGDVHVAHAWIEVSINGQDYVVDYNELVLASIFYQTSNWTK
jgi:hypothetical protein